MVVPFVVIASVSVSLIISPVDIQNLNQVSNGETTLMVSLRNFLSI
jgi:hypothetical protein